MSKGKSDPPAPPDPYAVSAAQTSTNVDTAVANSILGNANTYDPYGSTTFNQIGSTNIGGNDVPQWEKRTELAPAQQQMLDLQNETGINLQRTALNSSNQIGDLLAHPVDTNGLPEFAGAPQTPSFNGLPNGPQYTVAQLQSQGDSPFALQGNVALQDQATGFEGAGPIQSGVQQNAYATGFDPTSSNIVNSVGPQDFSADRQAVTDSLLSRLNPEIDRDRSSLETRLVNQGFVRGTQAFDQQMDEIRRQANDARQQAVLAGGQEQSRLAGLQLSQANFANSAQAQDYGQRQGRGMFALQGTEAQNASNLNAGNFANSSQAQLYGQNKDRGMFGNAAIGANNASNLAGGEFQNSAAGQAFAQQQAQIAFNNAVAQGNSDGANAAAQAAYSNSVSQTQYGNTNAQQGFANNTSNAQLNNQARAQGLQERFSMASFPINQITALTSGGQIQAPQTVNYAGGQIAPTNVSGNVYNSAALAEQNYAQQMAQENATTGALAGIAGSAARGFFGSATKPWYLA